MPGKIKVKVLAGRNLPVMDRASETTDAFVEIRFGGVTHKTDVCRKSLNPQWNSTEWYRFEVDESELQDEPLQLRVMDHDTYSANDAIGKVVISLAPLLSREPAPSTKPVPGSHPGAVMSGWIPVFDTMHGIRGELNVIVKVELFADFNKYKTSSCGVQFFHCPTIPPGHKATAIHGFVEELVVNDDPEYQWIDKIRTPRASNEARQAAFIKLSNQVQRLVGLKASELGANAVVGYQQAFDLEGEAGVVARAIGTAISIEPLPTPSQPITIPPYSQQQLKKYLDILATDSDSITDLNEYFKTHQEELQNFLHILHPNLSSNLLDDPENDDEMKASCDSSIKNYAENVSIYQDEYISQESLKHIAEDQTELNKLLNQEDKEYEEESTGTAAKFIKKLKPSFFTKRFGSGRSKKSDKAEDTISIKSNSSDASRISMAELRNEFKKLKRLRKPKFRRSVSDNDDGVGMASILARSVMHAHTSSLACIAETQDSEHSPCSTIKRTSESEPKISTSDEEKAKKKDKISPNQEVNDYEPNNQKVPKINFGSLKNMNTVDGSGFRNARKLSISCPNSPPMARMQNLLKLPGEEGYFGSISSALSGESSEFYSSTDEDDESSDLKTDTEKSIETTSSIVQSVLKQEANPAFISQMEKKLTAMEHKGLPEIKITDRINTKSSSETNILDAVSMSKLKIPEQDKTTGPSTAPITNNPNHHHFKFHNPFAHKKASRCLSEPSSPTDKKFNILNRSSKRLKSQFAKLSKSNMIKSISHIPLMPKKKSEEPQISRPHSSGSDIGSKGRDTVLGSPFMSYSDLLSLYKDVPESKHTEVSDDNAKVQMYIGSEPVSRMSLSGPSSPRSLDDKEEHHNIFEHKNGKKDKECYIKPTGLLLTAMETILMDKVQSLLIPATPDNVNTNEQRFFDDVNEKLEKVEEMRNKETENTSHLKKLVRQDSIHSSLENVADPSHEMSKVDTNDHKPILSNRFLKSKLVLQHLHPIMSGPIHPKLCHLETIPSLPETSFDYSLDENEISLDIPTVEVSESETNVLGDSVVCDNSHAECGGPVPREKEVDKEKGSPKHSRHESYGGRDPLGTLQNSSLNASSTPVGIHRRSSDSDLSVTPKGSGQTASVGNAGGAILKPSMNSNNIDMLEYPFLTMAEYPPGFIVHLAGCVFSRSVKLVDGGGEAATRAAWWTELRTEIRSHMRALRCNAVLAYSETTAICEDVCVLSASGTAAVINLDCDFGADVDNEECASAHVPYSVTGGTYCPELPPCSVCGRPQVPRVLLVGVSRPAALLAAPVANTISAVVSRVRRTPPQSEPGARDISDQLPFLEYELHKLLLSKLRMQGANAIFNLQTQIAVGERCVAALASGTAVRLNALPAPTPPRIKLLDNDKDALELQKSLWETFSANKTANGYDAIIPEYKTNGVLPEVENEDNPSLELCADKDACVLELDEAEEIETARSLCHRRSYLPVLTAHPSIKVLPKASPYAFAQVWRGRFQGNTLSAEKHVARALDGVHYKLRTLKPCALTPTRFQIELAEDEIQLVLTGAAFPLLDPNKPEHRKIIADDLNRINKAKTTQPNSELGQGDEDEIFTLDVEQSPVIKNNVAENVDDKILNSNQVPLSVSLSPMGATGGRVRHVCALRLLFVRESTAVRELGGLSGFLHTAMSEVLAIVRAYTTALGGNTLTSFYITQLMLQDNAHKNQGQCLLSVGGDVVHLTY